jgi:hypothetical protein
VQIKRFFFVIFLSTCILGFASAKARAQKAAPAHAASTATLEGYVADPTGARIPGTQIIVTNALGVTVKKVYADLKGNFTVTGLAAGKYIVEAQVPGFTFYTSPAFALAAGQIKVANITLTLKVAQQQVHVHATESGLSVSTAPSANTNSMVITGKKLNTLSNDPSELANELQALAGPSAGPSGGQIYIDGFTGGQLPPKSAIERIVVNQNPFSAKYSKLGYGRIEILTKPGSASFHGSMFVMGNDSAFNTLNPFTGAIPSYHSYMFNGTVSGPIAKNASYFFSGQQRNLQNDDIYTARTAVFDPTTNAYVEATQAGGLLSPGTYTNISPRIDLQLGQNNTLSLLYQYFRTNQTNSLAGSTSLPSQAHSATSTENIFEFDDTQIINSNLVNETRFEFRRANSLENPASVTPSVVVPTFFTAGGDSAQHFSMYHNHYEFQDFATLTAGHQTFNFGTWDFDDSENITTNGGFNGSFDFQSLNSYLDTLNGLAKGETISEIAAACPSGQVCTPIKLDYTTGPEDFAGNVFTGALFFEDDWQTTPNLTLSAGVRFETQNHVPDHADWAPRFDFAWAPGHKGAGPQKTVIRGGYGFFYRRFAVGQLMNLEQFNGNPNSLHQQQHVIDNPTCFSSTGLDSIPNFPSSCGAATTGTSQIDSLSPTYRSPYTEMLAIGVERQLTKNSTLTFTYLHSYGVHRLVTRDANAYEPLPGTVFYNSTTGPRPNPNFGPIDQYYSEGIFKENQIIVNFNAQLTRNFGFFGFYNYSVANTDGGGGSNPSNSYDLMQDYGRAYWVHPQFVLLVGTYTGPFGIIFNPFLLAHQGHPYNITTSTDLTGDNFFNDRPAYASSSFCPSTSSTYVATSFGCLNVNPQPGDTLVPIDLGNSPSSVAMNLRVSRAFGVGPKGPSVGGGPPMGPHGRGGFHGFGNPFSGLRHAINGHHEISRKYTLTFSAHLLNLFNDINYGTPSGSIIPTLDTSTGTYVPDTRFEESTNLAGGIFSNGSSARRIYLHASFVF